MTIADMTPLLYPPAEHEHHAHLRASRRSPAEQQIALQYLRLEQCFTLSPSDIRGLLIIEFGRLAKIIASAFTPAHFFNDDDHRTRSRATLYAAARGEQARARGASLG